MKPVELVKVYDLISIYKNGEEANAIQVARVETADGEQLQYDIVVGKGLYSIGDSVIYIQPDYSIPQTNVFMEYHLPDGDASKCRLGKKGRVRAIKFNFQFKDDFNPIFSCGIILPLIGEIKETVDNCEDGDLQKAFNVTKYVSEDSLDASQPSGNAEDFPSFLYKTDETTCLDENVEIITEDGVMTIKNICETKYKGKVLSFNIEKKENELKNILDHTISKRNKDWYEIELENNIKIKATGNHYFYLPNLKCFRKVEELKINDFLQIKN